MAEGSGTDCSLEIQVIGCVGTGYWDIDAIIVIVPVLFGLWMKLLGGET